MRNVHLFGVPINAARRLLASVYGAEEVLCKYKGGCAAPATEFVLLRGAPTAPGTLTIVHTAFCARHGQPLVARIDEIQRESEGAPPPWGGVVLPSVGEA